MLLKLFANFFVLQINNVVDFYMINHNNYITII
jgi:hypothetical protein